MRNKLRVVFISSLALVFGLGLSAAFAALERVGPVNAANGFPAWYQDKTGLVLEFCQPQTQAELDGGWCFLVPGDTTVPEVFPTPFAEEHFYWAADAGIDFTENGITSRARLVLGLEAAFAQGPVVDGDQIVFGRIRVRIDDLPYDGDYTVYHPYGKWVFTGQVAGERLFVTEDIGFNCAAGQFDCALVSNLGPFLLPSNTPGGAELPAVSGPGGKLYIADPARLGPVTGSPLLPFSVVDASGNTVEKNHNIFRVEGPNGWVIETSNFTLMGRVFTNTLPGRVKLDRASYTRTASAQKVDVFATAFPTTQGRIPPNEAPVAVAPLLSFFPAPCGVDPVTGALTEPPAASPLQMFSSGSTYWGQAQPATLPLQVCVEEETARYATGQLVPAFFQAEVTDEVTISEAFWNPADGGNLTVRAVSSDEVVPPVLTLSGFGDLTSGAISVTPMIAPPAKVSVLSSHRGMSELQVKTGFGTAAVQSGPVAANDDLTVMEDSVTNELNVLANDTYTGAATVTITGPAMLGTATVGASGSIVYTPYPNAYGTDGIIYTVTAGGLTSLPAYLTINITPVNDLPVASNDTFSVVAGISILNVLANDSDPDGAADLANVLLDPLTLPQGASITVDPGGMLTFETIAAGTYTFAYQAQDSTGALSNAATVTVAVTLSETIVVQQAEFRTSDRRWRVSGTDSVRAGQTLTIAFVNGTNAGGVIGTAVVGPTGTWALDVRGGERHPRSQNDGGHSDSSYLAAGWFGDDGVHASQITKPQTLCNTIPGSTGPGIFSLEEPVHQHKDMVVIINC